MDDTIICLNWISGGFNDVWAFNVKEARDIIKKQCKESEIKISNPCKVGC